MLAATKPPTLPDFATPEERATYIKEHAEFFTVISRKHLRNLRLEYESIEAARAAAQIVANFLGRTALIYAVLGPYDSLVEVVQPGTQG